MVFREKFMGTCAAAVLAATGAGAASLGVTDDRAAFEAGTATAWAELGTFGLGVAGDATPEADATARALIAFGLEPAGSMLVPALHGLAAPVASMLLREIGTRLPRATGEPRLVLSDVVAIAYAGLGASPSAPAFTVVAPAAAQTVAGTIVAAASAPTTVGTYTRSSFPLALRRGSGTAGGVILAAADTGGTGGSGSGLEPVPA